MGRLSLRAIAAGAGKTVLAWFPLAVLAGFLSVPVPVVLLGGILSCFVGGCAAGSVARRPKGIHGFFAGLFGLLVGILLAPLALMIVAMLQVAAASAAEPTAGASTAYGVKYVELAQFSTALLLLTLLGGYLGGRLGERLTSV